MVEPSSTEGMENLMNAMRRKQNIALAREAWEDASLIQRALVTILDARAGANLIGMSMAVIETTRGISIGCTEWPETEAMEIVQGPI